MTTKRRTLFTDSAKKRKRILYQKNYRQRIALTQINIGAERLRWEDLKEKLKLETDCEMAKVLLDKYCGIGSQTQTTSTPSKGGAPILPQMSELSSIPSSSDAERNKSLPEKKVQQTSYVYEDDITNDNIETDVQMNSEYEGMNTDFDDDGDGGMTYIDDEDDSDYEPQFLKPSYCNTSTYTEGLPVAGAEDVDEHGDVDDEDDDEEADNDALNDSIVVDEIADMLNDKMGIVFCSKLLELAHMTPPEICNRRICNAPTNAQLFTKATGLRVHWVCNNGHLVKIWRSQPLIKSVQAGDFLLSCCVLTSGNNFYKIKHLFDLLNIGCVSAATYFAIQSKYGCTAVYEYWDGMQKKILNEIRGRELVLLGDGQNDSPGHCAQYLNYNIIDNESGNLIICDVVDKRQTQLNSNRMEIFSFSRSLDFLIEDQQSIKEVVTDGHIGIKSYMAKEKPTIKHSNDIWHGAKSVTKRLSKVIQSRNNRDLITWAKKVVNHFWYCAKTCEGDQNIFKARWRGVLHHVVNEHVWLTGDGVIEPKCEHGELLPDEERKWLSKGSSAHTALIKVVLDKALLKNVPYYVNFRHTGNIEAFHSFKLMYTSKRFAYSPPVYKARCLLAAIDFNTNKDREVLEDKDGNPQYKRVYSKRADNWSVTPIKAPKNYQYTKDLLCIMVEKRMNDEFCLRKRNPREEGDPRNIAPTTAKKLPESVSDILKRQKSRF